METITFEDALKRLGIEKYKDRIWHSNSHGELFHLADYFWFNEITTDNLIPLFTKSFEMFVEHADKTWERPDSVFQHMPRMFKDYYSKVE